MPYVDDKIFAQTNFGLRIPKSLSIRGNYAMNNYQGQEMGDIREFRSETGESEEYMRILLDTDITHRKPPFECSEREIKAINGN